MIYGGNPDNIWKRESALDRCLKSRIKSFGSLDSYFTFMRRYVTCAGGHPYENALDVGCGKAVVSTYLASLGIIQNLTLLDKFQEILEKNRMYIATKCPGLNGRVYFVKKDVCKEPIDRKYDLVLASTVTRASELRRGNNKVENVFNAVDRNGRVIISVCLKAEGETFSDFRKQTIRKGIELLMDVYEIQFVGAAMGNEEIWVTGKRE